jgi:hypothetical protein
MGKSLKTKQRKAEAEESAFRQRFVHFSRQAAIAPPVQPLIDEFTGYLDHCVRSPDAFVLRTRSNHRDKQALELARHLFGRFRVPRILEQVWAAYLPDTPTDRRVLPQRAPGELVPNQPLHLATNLSRCDFRAWFVCVATGGSLYKAHAKDWLTKKETHLFLGAPPTLELCQAMIYAVARAAGAPEGGALRLARSKLAQKEFGPFWFDVVRFFCLPDHMPTSIAIVNDLADYLDNRHREDAAFRLLGSAQTLPAVLRRMEQWHRSLARAKDLIGISWPGVDRPDHIIEQRDPDNKKLMLSWCFHQIITGRELAAEGSAMRHCVFGYKTRCMSGECSIWSLTRTDAYGVKTRRLTIEVDRYGKIAQKRGLANRLPRPEENHLLDRWAQVMNFQNSSHNGW